MQSLCLPGELKSPETGPPTELLDQTWRCLLPQSLLINLQPLCTLTEMSFSCLFNMQPWQFLLLGHLCHRSKIAQTLGHACVLAASQQLGLWLFCRALSKLGEEASWGSSVSAGLGTQIFTSSLCSSTAWNWGLGKTCLSRPQCLYEIRSLNETTDVIGHF